MKRSKLSVVLAALLALCMIFSACSSSETTTTAAATDAETEAPKTEEAKTDAATEAATEAPTEAATEAPTEPVQETKDSITLGLLQGIVGDFGGSEYISGSGVDDDTMFRLFSHGYSVSETDRDSKYEVNATAVKDLQITDEADGGKTFAVTLNEGLVYSDGTPITAKDYVARILYVNSPAFAEAGGKNYSGERFEGHTAYSKGESETFSGVHLTGDYSFTIKVTKETVYDDGTAVPNFPDFEEIRYMEYVYPLLLSAWTNDGVELDVEETENGVKFTTPLTVDMIDTAFNTQRYTPTYSCAPYMFKSWDANGKIGVMEINPNFAGNWEGQKPSIKEIIFKDVYGSTYTDELKTGSVDIICTIGKGADIDTLMDLVDQGKLGYNANYANSIQGFVCRCDTTATQFKEVRQAITQALDRQSIAAQMTQGYGTTTNGCFTPVLWMYEETRDELESVLDPYNYSLADAEQRLIDGGWVYDKDGNDYVSQGKDNAANDNYRYKKLDDGSLMKCSVNCIGTPTSTFCEITFAMCAENLPQIGMEYTFEKLEWAVCLQYLAREVEDPVYSLICCGHSGFTAGVYDVTGTYTQNKSAIAVGENSYMLIDPHFDELARAILNTEAGDEEAYLKNFVEFQKYWNELVPHIPIYVPASYDFYPANLKNFDNDTLTGIRQSILYAYFE